MFLFLLCVVPLVGVFSGAVNPIFRGMMSRLVGPDEQGIKFGDCAIHKICQGLHSMLTVLPNQRTRRNVRSCVCVCVCVCVWLGLGLGRCL